MSIVEKVKQLFLERKDTAPQDICYTITIRGWDNDEDCSYSTIEEYYDEGEFNIRQLELDAEEIPFKAEKLVTYLLDQKK
jgi:hypothetical protein